MTDAPGQGSDAAPVADPPWDADAAVAAVRQRVQTYLLRETEVTLDQQGRIIISRGSTRLFINFYPQEHRRLVFVTLTAPIAYYVPMTPALFEKIARDSDKWYFGHLCLSPYPEDSEHKGTAYVYLSESLVGDFLDPQEITVPVLSMAGTADEIDDEFVKEFGGGTWANS